MPVTDPSTCSRCGAPLGAGRLECPRCLLALGAAPPAERDDDARRAEPSRSIAHDAPSIDDVRAAFPELEVVELIGRGGMGAVFKARQPKLQRTIALKVLPRELGEDPAFAERFLREARALARLSHAGIVAVHDFGVSSGLYFLVMEHVDGVDLRRAMRERPLAPRQALSIARELCDALQYAHDEGVVHRDVKPENVLLDARGRVKIADFGLAKLVDAGVQPALTRSDQVMGTPHYMAPEQLERPLEVDHRADIFALGVVLYEMLTGSLPRGNFEPPSRRVHVDVKLDEIVLKALEREPSRRYQHALEVKSDVEHVELSSGEWTSEPANVAAPLERDPLRGARVIAAFLPMWIALGFAWNHGPIALGLAIAFGAALLSVAWRWRLRADPSLAHATRTTSRRTWRVHAALVFVGAFLSLGMIVAGHVAHWDRGVHGWRPAHRDAWTALDDLSTDPWSLMRIGGVADASVAAAAEPTLVSKRSFTHGQGWSSAFAPWALIGLGFLLLALSLHGRIVLSRPFALSVDAGRPGAELSAYALAALAALWVLGPLLSLRADRSMQGLERRVASALPAAAAADRLRLALLELETSTDVHHELAIQDRRDGAAIASAIVYRAQASDSLARWATAWRGPRRATPQIWAVVVGDERASGVLLRAGLYEVGSPDRDVALAALGALERALAAP